MSKEIEPKLLSISEYLKIGKQNIFVIPEYQRPYSWEKTQCDKLWQDIESFIESGAVDPYFFGTIIVDCSISNQYKLIDGQQRTTTFLLLLKALLLRLNEVIPQIANDDESESLKEGLKDSRKTIMAILYKADVEEIPLLLRDHSRTKNIVILDNKSINEKHSSEVEKIIEAQDFKEAEKSVYKFPRRQKEYKYTNHFRNFKFFYDKLEKKLETQLNVFAKILLNCCQVIEIKSWQVEQAITMFNSLNSTGLQLADADIIAAQLYSNAGDDRNSFEEEWKAIKELADKLNVRKITNIDGALQQLMYINRAKSREYISIKEDGTESINVTTPGLRRYYTENDESKKLLNSPLKMCSELSKILKNWDEIKDYPVVKLLLKFNENAKIFLAGFLSRFDCSEISKDAILEFCESLVKLFAILELSDYGFSSSKFKTFLFGENVKLVDKDILLRTIKNDFNEHICKNWKREELFNNILEYDHNILVFLNEYIYSKNQGVKFNFAENVNIEHIMPSSGKNILQIQKDANIANSEEFLDYVNKLGNKILLEEDINKSIGNEWFKTKKQNSIDAKSGYKNSKYAIAQGLTTYPKDTWTKEDIDIATKKAANRIVKFIFDE